MARKPEQRAYDNFRKASEGILLLHRVENVVRDGMPDVIGTNRNGGVFWLELKAIAAWPKRATSHPLAGRFEKGQLAFLSEWRSWGGNSFVLLRDDKDYILLPSDLYLDDWAAEKMHGECIAYGINEIIEYLKEL
jgi:penicillin-binding protein-related factor A (putative recombinase)